MERYPRTYEALIEYERKTAEVRGSNPVILVGDLHYINHIKAAVLDSFKGSVIEGYSKAEPHPVIPTLEWVGRISETHLYVTHIEPPSALQMNTYA